MRRTAAAVAAAPPNTIAATQIAARIRNTRDCGWNVTLRQVGSESDGLPAPSTNPLPLIPPGQVPKLEVLNPV
jgi:hypothetical protein